MNIMTMTKEDFDKVPSRYWNEDIGNFNSLVIIPMNKLHDSGFMCMDFVAINNDNEPIARLSGCSDVIHLDGLSGFGKRWFKLENFPNTVSIKGWSIDVLPCGYIRIFTKYLNALSCGNALSDFELFADVDDQTRGDV